VPCHSHAAVVAVNSSPDEEPFLVELCTFPLPSPNHLCQCFTRCHVCSAGVQQPAFSCNNSFLSLFEWMRKNTMCDGRGISVDENIALHLLTVGVIDLEERVGINLCGYVDLSLYG